MNYGLPAIVRKIGSDVKRTGRAIRHRRRIKVCTNITDRYQTVDDRIELNSADVAGPQSRCIELIRRRASNIVTGVYGLTVFRSPKRPAPGTPLSTKEASPGSPTRSLDRSWTEQFEGS